MNEIRFMSAPNFSDFGGAFRDASISKIRVYVPDSPLLKNNLDVISGGDVGKYTNAEGLNGLFWGISLKYMRHFIATEPGSYGKFIVIEKLDLERIAKIAFCLGCDHKNIPTITDSFGRLGILPLQYNPDRRVSAPKDEVDLGTNSQYRDQLRYLAQAFDLHPDYNWDSAWRGACLDAIQRHRVQETTPLAGGLASPKIARLDKLAPIFRGYISVDEVSIAHEIYGGGLMQSFGRSVVGWGDAVTVLPYDPKNDLVLLIEQFRPGPFLRGEANPWCHEVVMGRLDQNETIEETARREAQEEAGLAVGRLERVAAYYSSPGQSREYVTSYIAEAELTNAGGQFGSFLENEDIRAIVLTLDSALAKIFDGSIIVSHAHIALLALANRRRVIRKKWLAKPDQMFL